jgi:hypothetical protein
MNTKWETTTYKGGFENGQHPGNGKTTQFFPGKATLGDGAPPKVV